MRRRILFAGLAGAALACPAQAAPARRRPPAPAIPGPGDAPRLAVQFAHTGAWFRGPFKAGDAVDPAALRDFSAVMADWRTGEVKGFDPALLDLLWKLGREVGVREFTCVSGYRSARTNALVGGAPDSQHMDAKALDLWLPGTKLAEAVGKLTAMRAGGVGAYPTWLHLDTGPVRTWDKRRGDTGDTESLAPMMARRGRLDTSRGLAEANGTVTTRLSHGRQWVMLDRLEDQAVGSPRAALRILNLR